MNAPHIHYFTVEHARSHAGELLVSVGAPGKNLCVYNTLHLNHPRGGKFIDWSASYGSLLFSLQTSTAYFQSLLPFIKARYVSPYQNTQIHTHKFTALPVGKLYPLSHE